MRVEQLGIKARMGHVKQTKWSLSQNKTKQKQKQKQTNKTKKGVRKKYYGRKQQYPWVLLQFS